VHSLLFLPVIFSVSYMCFYDVKSVSEYCRWLSW